ncbi:MAG: SPASM domain-containing protein [Desulfuromonas sp.]|nr:SPASM domain-containing protein [Desulfuromonas sp.]
MGLDLLDTPVRLTWDLHGPGQPLSDGAMLAIAGRIVDAGVFFVTLEARPLVHPALPEILAELVAGGCQVQVACAGDEEELAALEALPIPRPRVQLDIAAFLPDAIHDAGRLRIVLERLRHIGIDPTLCLIPLKSNLPMIPSLLRLCRELGAGRFKLPNARIGDTFQSCPIADLPRWQDLEAYRAQWAAANVSAADLPELEIHDRFLWEIMTPENDQARSEYGGCQAANSLGHVDASGTVHPCAAWPEVLGSLCGADLERIWLSPARFAVRERIARIPAGCAGCRDYPLCLGGCRGLGESLNQAAGGRDPMCREPRR